MEYVLIELELWQGIILVKFNQVLKLDKTLLLELTRSFYEGPAMI